MEICLNYIKRYKGNNLNLEIREIFAKHSMIINLTRLKKF